MNRVRVKYHTLSQKALRYKCPEWNCTAITTSMSAFLFISKMYFMNIHNSLCHQVQKNYKKGTAVWQKLRN